MVMILLELSFLLLRSCVSIDSAVNYHEILYPQLHLRSAAFNFPPFMIEKKVSNDLTKNVTYSGYGAEILTSLKDHYQIVIDYIPVDQSDVQKFGITQAVVNQLVVKKEVDILPMILIWTPQRALIMDFTLPIMIGSSKLMVPYPKEESRTTAFVGPYSVSIWILIVISALSVSATMSFFSYYQRLWLKGMHYAKDLSRILKHEINYTLTALLNQGDYLPYYSLPSMRIVAGFWCLVAIVLVNAYQGTLTSFLAIPKLSPVPQSLEELVASGKKYKLVAEINSATTEAYYAAKFGPHKAVGDNLRQYPYLLFRDFDQATDIMLKYGAGYMRGGLEIVNRIAVDLKANNGTCRFTASKYLSDVSFLSFGLSKGSPYNEPINKKLIILRDSGLLDRWFNMHMPDIRRCDVHGSRPDIYRSVKSYGVSDLAGSFIFLVFNTAICTLVFLCEVFAFYWPKRQRKIVDF